VSSEEKRARWARIKKPVFVLFGLVFLVLFSLTTFEPFVRLYDQPGRWIGFVPLPQFMILLSAWGMAAALGVLYLIERHYEA